MKTVKLLLSLLFIFGGLTVSASHFPLNNQLSINRDSVQYFGINTIYHPLQNIISFLPYTSKFVDIKGNVDETINKEKKTLPENIKGVKKEIEKEIKSEWNEFRKSNGWLGSFFKEETSRKELIKIKEILEEQKNIVKQYLSNEKNLFEVYEIVGFLEPYIKTEKLGEYNEYMYQKIDILKRQKRNIYEMKKNIKETTIQLKKDIVKISPENDKAIIIDSIKSITDELPEEKREEFVDEFIHQINKKSSSFSEEVSKELKEEVLKKEN